jgi:hypothetical protein
VCHHRAAILVQNQDSREAMLSSSSRIIAVVIAAISFVRVSGDEAVGQRETLARVNQTRELFQGCDNIIAISSSKSLSRDIFALLLQQVSGREYEKLPLEYSLVFNMNACRSGRDCIGNQANISISNKGERDFVCFTLASMLDQSASSEIR